MAGAYYCTTWTCTDSPRADSIRITTGLVHPVRCVDLHSGHPLLRPFVQDPARDGL
jgi:hypothetical protein